MRIEWLRVRVMVKVRVKVLRLGTWVVNNSYLKYECSNEYNYYGNCCQYYHHHYHSPFYLCDYDYNYRYCHSNVKTSHFR
jgi:hypothetical protein